MWLNNNNSNNRVFRIRKKERKTVKQEGCHTTTISKWKFSYNRWDRCNEEKKEEVIKVGRLTNCQLRIRKLDYEIDFGMKTFGR